MIKRADANQAKLMEQIRQVGWSVRSTHTIGKGFVDIVVGAHGKNFCFEIKDPAKTPSQRKLTPDEQIFFNTWKGQVNIAETIEDIIKVVNQEL